MPTWPGIEKFKKVVEKFKKLENTIIAFFQVKIGRERPRKREKKKKIVPMGSNLTGNRKFQKNSKKINKFRKHHHSLFSSQNKLGKAEKGRK